MAQKTGLAKPSHRFYDQLRPTWRCWSRKKFSLGCAIVEVGLMDTYVRAMQERLKAKKIGYNRAFLRDLVKEVKVDGDQVTLPYRLPLEIEPPPDGGGGSKRKFFTVCQLVEAGGTTIRV
jgi:hypothetical protein